jgi:5'-3' exonuclease
MAINILKYLEEKALLSIDPATMVTRSVKLCEPNEIIISGDKNSLVMLADYIVSVALSNVKGKHIHLDTNNFFDESAFDIIIEKVD